jgi:hypothetical protein
VANDLQYYNPFFYANEALIHLWKALGMARRVHRGYDEERRSFGKGEYINIKSPSTFTAADAPATAADLVTRTVQIQLAYWREVKFKLTDRELAFTSEKIIEDHIQPAAYALADDIDQKLVALAPDICHLYEMTYEASTPTAAVVGDIIGPRKVMFDNAVPIADVGRMHMMIDSGMEADLLGLSAFSQQQGAGDTGVSTQMRGTLGTKYGLEIFANQNSNSIASPGALTTITGATELVGAHSNQASSITFDAATSLVGTMKDGDLFQIDGDAYAVAVGNGTSTAAANAITVNVSPLLRKDYADNATITNHLGGVDLSLGQLDRRNNLAFHRNAFALVMAPLSSMANELGARIATVTDPVTGLSLRSRVYYVGNSSEVHVALDTLYGVKTLDPDLAVRAAEDLTP